MTQEIATLAPPPAQHQTIAAVCGEGKRPAPGAITHQPANKTTHGAAVGTEQWPNPATIGTGDPFAPGAPLALALRALVPGLRQARNKQPTFPSNHRPVALYELASFQTGLRVVKRQFSPDGEIGIIRKRDIVNGHLQYDLARTTSRVCAHNHVLKGGDLVLHSHYGSFTPIVIDEAGEPMACATPLVAIRIQDKTTLLPEYLAWYLRTSSAHQTLAAYAGQAKPAHAAIEGLYAVCLPKPRPEVQRLISGIARLLQDFQECARTQHLDSVSAADADTFERILERLARF